MITIRDETSDEHQQVRIVTVDAFTASQLGHHGEADLINALRCNGNTHLSLVACRDHEIVGHILFTPVAMRTAQAEWHGMGLGPLSVTPTLQCTGIGSSLVTAGCARLFADACPFVVVLGRPEYYSHFGFHRASQHRIRHGFAGIPQHAFSIRIGPGETPERLRDGFVCYCHEFGVQHADTGQQTARDRERRRVKWE